MGEVREGMSLCPALKGEVAGHKDWLSQKNDLSLKVNEFSEELINGGDDF